MVTHARMSHGAPLPVYMYIRSNSIINNCSVVHATSTSIIPCFAAVAPCAPTHGLYVPGIGQHAPGVELSMHNVL